MCRLRKSEVLVTNQVDDVGVLRSTVRHIATCEYLPHQYSCAANQIKIKQKSVYVNAEICLAHHQLTSLIHSVRAYQKKQNSRELKPK